MNLRSLCLTSAALLSLISAASVQAAVPVVTTFTTVPSSNSPVTVTAFVATDNDGSVVGYMCTDSNTKPAANSPNWSPIPPQSCSTSKSGSLVFYAWAKDDTNGVSNGKAYTTWVPGGHAHAIADVTNLQETLDGKAPAAHDHDTLYLRRYGKVAVVALNGGDYGCPLDAMNAIAAWCGVPSTANPCLVKIMPGRYDLQEASLAMLEYVDIEGSGETTTLLTSSTSGAGTVNGASNAEIRSLTIENTGSGRAITCTATAPKLSNLTATAVYGGLEVVDASPSLTNVAINVVAPWGVGVPTAIGVYGDGSAPAMSNVTASVSGGVGNYALLFDGRDLPVRPILHNVSATATGSMNWATAVYLTMASPFMSNVTAYATGGGGSGIYVRNSTVRQRS